jgi:hypothetical protein
LIPLAAPSASARSSFASLLEVMITRAPISFANWSAKSDTPPVPCVSTTSPGLTAPLTARAFQAVTAAQGKVAACSSVRCSGTRTSPSSCSATNSANMPSISPPSAVRALAGVSSPSSQPCMKQPATRSPRFTRA